MIICLSGFVIAGTSPTSMPVSARNDISMVERVGAGGCAGVAGVAGGARYSPHHHQLLQHFAPPARLRVAGAGRSGSSSPESGSSLSASPPPPAAPAPRPAAPPHRVFSYRTTRVRTLYACLGESEGELSFEPNQIITNVSASAEPGWLRGSLNGKTGLVPENYVEPLP